MERRKRKVERLKGIFRIFTRNDEENAYNRGFICGLEKGIEIGKRTYADQDYLDFEDGKITMNEYRQRKGLQPMKEEQDEQ